ncbi:serine hydrolase [Sanyastnella coralliicola]|uniref:serine hydrolase n=1 Tax=Sanyastnella coralliicola TaxID=3069118 RepID=UPI0027BAF5DE|nr:serine hydrolase [Longitalea sp. SCSIO 12813]
MKSLLSLCLILLPCALFSQLADYYPPNDSEEWDTIGMDALGWCEDELDTLISFLDDRNSKAFIVLHQGRIVIEEYFDEFNEDSLWVWNSAGKTVTAFTVGMAQEEGFLDINDPTSNYLGEGWTSLTPEQEQAITVWNQLTMTSGLDDGVNDVFCTDPECLQFLESPGDRWAYHNGPYTLLTEVIEEAVGMNYNLYTFSKLDDIGMSGFYAPIGFNRIYLSDARDMARFGLMIENNGYWDGDFIMDDTDSFQAMVTPSQELNESYGYLWWLNGQDSHLLPGLQLELPGPIVPSAPDDMIAAIGKDSQLINVVSSEDLVVIRMGASPDNSLVPTNFSIELWELLSNVICSDVAIAESDIPTWKIYPNPAQDQLTIQGIQGAISWELRNAVGQLTAAGNQASIDLSSFTPGLYFLTIDGSTQRVIVQ